MCPKSRRCWMGKEGITGLLESYRERGIRVQVQQGGVSLAGASISEASTQWPPRASSPSRNPPMPAKICDVGWRESERGVRGRFADGRCGARGQGGTVRTHAANRVSELSGGAEAPLRSQSCTWDTAREGEGPQRRHRTHESRGNTRRRHVS